VFQPDDEVSPCHMVLQQKYMSIALANGCVTAHELSVMFGVAGCGWPMSCGVVRSWCRLPIEKGLSSAWRQKNTVITERGWHRCAED
jgi:hypothetical protein